MKQKPNIHEFYLRALSAVRSRDFETFKQTCDSHPEVLSISDPDTLQTILFEICIHGGKDFAQYYVDKYKSFSADSEKKINVEIHQIAGSGSRTALTYAARYDNHDVIQIIIEHLDPKQINFNSLNNAMNAAMFAAKFGNTKSLSLLLPHMNSEDLEYRAYDYKDSTVKRKNLLDFAQESKNEECIQLVNEALRKPSKTTSNKYTQPIDNPAKPRSKL